MRRLQGVAAAGHRARLYRDDAEPALAIRRHSAKATEIGIERLIVLPVVGMAIAPRRVGLPDLDDRIRHRRTVAIEDAALDGDPFAGGVVTREVSPFGPVHAEMKKWTNRIGWC